MSGSFLHSIKALVGATDEQAMWRVKMHDDAQAFSLLVDRWVKPIRYICARMTGDLHRAEDLTQDSFARVFSHRKDYQPQGKFSTYLWRVALNLCYDELRRLKRRGEQSLSDGEEKEGEQWASNGPSPEHSLLAQERADLVRRALLCLPDAYRSVVVLKHYENLKFREIAEVLDIPEGTVKSRMAEGLTQLSQMLRRAFEDKNTALWKVQPIKTAELLVL